MSDIKSEIIQELHKPVLKHFKRCIVVTKGINDLVQVDLVEMIPYVTVNKNFRCTLLAINLFSKFVWTESVKKKTCKDVAIAMKKNLTKMPRKPKNLQTEKGKDFYNDEF